MSGACGTTAVPGSNLSPPGKILTALIKDLTNRIILASSKVEKELSMIKKHSMIRIKPL